VKVPALAAFLVCTTALAQAPTPTPNPPPDAGTANKASASPPAAPADAPSKAAQPTSASTVQLDEAIQREIDARVAQAKKELQDEMRAQSATAAATQAGFEDANITSRTKLQLFVAHGYFRVRPEFFNYLDLGQPPFNGYYLFPVPDGGGVNNPGGHSITGVNMRFRLEPTINVSEELRIKSQIDMLNNLVWGSTGAYAYTGYQCANVAFLSTGQVPPSAGLNAAINSIQVNQAYGEVSTPVGLLKFGRMSSNFGLGINYNDGSCLDCDFQTDIDAFQFIAEPLPGFFVIPMIEVDVAGLINAPLYTSAEQLPATNSQGSTSYRIVLARLDTEQQAKAKLASGGTVFNYGLDFAFRTNKYEYKQVGALGATYNPQPDPYQPSGTLTNRVARFGNLSIPDIWLKLQTRTLRIELEAVSYLGEFSAPVLPGGVPTNVNVVEFGVAGEADLKVANGAVVVGFKGGFASGDSAPGFGIRVTRPTRAAGATTTAAQPGDIDGSQFGRQYPCPGNPARTCTDTDIRNYTFNADYHIDQILWRYILGTITDAWYLRPSVQWNITDSLQLDGNIVYSQAIYASSTPSASQVGLGSYALGLEVDLGIRYQTEDGLFAWLYYGILFPFDGLQNTSIGGIGFVGLHVAQSIRAMVGIRF
jgi:uncharacterized protein (TIGR04551 family)